MVNPSDLNPSLVGGHYHMLRQLGRGGFSHTYLAEDVHRFNELCVLKAFDPQVNTSAALEKAQQLFEREAGILYQLNHPQIPRFRELLRHQGQLYLVQDYVEGPSYQELLETRRQYAGAFSEAEVLELLSQLLPVLQYIHGVGIVHRDIAPDNLIQRNADGLPVLIDFGGVKQLAVNVRHQLGVQPAYGPAPVTLLGKEGFAPAEQMRSGYVDPSCDLYALGVTALVLLTGKDPQMLFDADTGMGTWQPQLSVSPAMERVLMQLVAPAAQRYPTAAAVMADLNLSSPYGGRWQEPLPAQMQPLERPPTPAYVPEPTATPTYTAKARPAKPRSGSGCGGALVGLLVLMAAVIGASWWIRQSRLAGQTTDLGDAAPSQTQPSREQALQQQANALGVSPRYLVRLSDQLFYEAHPELQGRALTDSPEDAALRQEWDAIATANLELMEAHLSTQAREQLGRYDAADLEGWKRRANQLYVSSRALYDLADAKFAQLFPGRRADVFVEQPTEQIWFALALDRLQSLESGQRLEEVRFQDGRFSQLIDGQLDPGEGQVYLLQMGEGDLFRLNLQAAVAQISFYVPSPSDELPYLLSDSEDFTWSGELPQEGYYEVVVVAGEQPVAYQLTTAVDRVTDDIFNTPAPPEDKD